MGEKEKPKTEPKTYSSNNSTFYKEKQAIAEPYYEEIAVMKKRKKKELPTTPTPCSKDLYEEILLDDLYEQVPSVPISNKESRSRDGESCKEEPARPFERFQEFLFKTFTTLVPWCLMKKVYWKRDRQSEQRFEDYSRRGSQSKGHVSKDRKSLRR